MKKNLLFLCLGMLCFFGQSFAQSISLTTTSTNGCAPFPVTFMNTSSIGNYTVWNFGDGSPNVFIYNTTHTFMMSGFYNVNMSVYDTTGKGMLFKGSQSTNINVNGANLYTSGDTVCPGETLSAYANPNGNNYSWTFGDGSPSSNQQNVSHTYTTVGVDTLKLTVQNNCGGIQHFARPIYVKVNGHPSASFGTNGGGNYCPNDIIQFYPSNNNASTYSWTFGDGGTSSQSQPTYSYTTTGTFTVSLTVTSSCGTSSTSSNTVNVTGNNYFPNFMSINSNSSQACPHDVLNFNYNGANALTAVWKFGTTDSIVDNSNNQNVNYSWLTAGTYTVTVKLHNGCNHDTTLAKVIQIKNNLPFTGNVGMQFGPNPACPNDVINFQGSNAMSYKWYFGDAAHDSSSLPRPQFSYPTTATYTVGLKLYNGCGRDTLILNTLVVNNSSPAVTLSHNHGGNGDNWGAPSSTSCMGDTVVFYAQSGMGSLHWHFGDGTSATGGIPLNVGNGTVYIMRHVYASNNTFNVKLTVTNGCGNSSSDSISFVVGGSSPVNGSLNMLTNGNNNQNVGNACQPVTMLGAGGSTYSWTFGDGGTLNTHAAQISHSYLTAGTYTVSLKVTNGCGNSATYSQTIVISGMNPSLAPTSLLCNGTNNGKIVESVNGGFAPYTYSINGGLYQTSNTFSNLTAASYTITIKDSLGCKVTSTTTLTEPTPLVLTPGSVNSSCGNATGSATATMSGGTPAYTYSWQAGGSTSNLAAQHAGSYLVTVTDANGCSTNATIGISDNGGPVVTYGGTQGPYCVNAGSLALSGGNPSGGTYTGSGVSGGAFFSPASAGVGVHTINYTVTSGGCTSSSTNTITVNALPHVTAFSTPANGEVCTGGSVTLNGGGASIYSWSGGKTDGIAFVPGGTLTYTVTGTDGNNCTNTASIGITVNPYPVVALSFTGHDTVGDCQVNVNLNQGTPFGGTYSGTAISGNTFNPSASGDGAFTITYTFTSAAGCAASHNATIHVLPCPLAVINLTASGMKIFPNPNNGIFTVETPDQTGTLQVMNAIGQVVYTEKITQSSHVLNLQSHPNGMYLIKIEGSAGIAIQRIFVVR